jgi:nucleotide-binding universal stress UspA family protein
MLLLGRGERGAVSARKTRRRLAAARTVAQRLPTFEKYRKLQRPACAAACGGGGKMKRFQHILATTDLSPESFTSVRYAAHLAKAQGAKLTILHVSQAAAMLFTDFVPPLDLVALDREVEASAHKQLEAWVKRNIKKDVDVRIVVRAGFAHETICKVAEETGASVIVMATHGRKGLGHVLLGSVTERVLRTAPCPVLVVRPPAATVKSKKAA